MAVIRQQGRFILHSAQLGTVLRSILVLPLLLYVGTVLLLYTKQEQVLFHPEPLPADYAFDLPGVEEAFIPVEGATLHALHFRQPQARGVIFFLHGNAGNVAGWLNNTRFYERTGFDVVMLDYRGFGKSTGRISSEAQLHADVRAAWDHFAPEYAGRLKVIYGRSIGTGLAARLATEVQADLLVLVSPYSSMQQLVAEKFPIAPSAILRYRLPTETWLPQVKMPVMIFHGTEDRTIPIEHTERLMQVRQDAEFVPLPGISHNDIGLSRVHVERLEARLRTLRDGAGSPDGAPQAAPRSASLPAGAPGRAEPAR